MMIKNVKKVMLSLSMIILLAMTTNCSDDDVTAKEELNLVGTWTAVDIVRTNCTGGGDGTITLDCPDFCLTFKFNSDGTSTITYKDPSSTTAQVDEGFYTLVGNALTICDNNNTNCDAATIVEIDNSTLSYSIHEEDTGCDTVTKIKRI